jgi:hypothetical protein
LTLEAVFSFGPVKNITGVVFRVFRVDSAIRSASEGIVSATFGRIEFVDDILQSMDMGPNIGAIELDGDYGIPPLLCRRFFDTYQCGSANIFIA